MIIQRSFNAMVASKPLETFYRHNKTSKKTDLLIVLSIPIFAIIAIAFTTIALCYQNKRNRSLGFTNHEFNEKFYRIRNLSVDMDKNENNQEVIYDCLKQINSILKESLFSKDKMCLPEEKKNGLIDINGLFTRVNKHYQFLENKDPDLAMQLKIRLANLPLKDQNPGSFPTDRQKMFPNIYFSQKDQLDTLIKHFKNQEDACVTQLISDLAVGCIDKKDLPKLAKMVSPSRSHLSPDNMLKLKNALIANFNNGVVDKLDDVQMVQNKLESAFEKQAYIHFEAFKKQAYYKSDLFNKDWMSTILKLHRVSKARQYFDNQKGWKEEEIQIPRWYHTTQPDNISPVIKTGQINVEHKKAFKGAWISTNVEWKFGNNALVFNHHIAKLDPNVFIGYKMGIYNRRWRGMQTPIPLVDNVSKISNVCLIGLNKQTIKTDKAQTIANLANIGVSNPKIFTIDQVQFMQDEIMKTIGTPNLSDGWW